MSVDNQQKSAGSNQRKYYRRGGKKGQRPTVPQNNKFKGSCPDLQGYIFDIGPSQAAAFSRTKNAIQSYAWRTFSPEVGKSVKHMANMRHLYQVPRDPEPATPGGELSFTQKEVARYQARAYQMRIDKYDSDLMKVYSVILEQCTDELKQALDGDAEYATVAVLSDPIRLLKMVQRLCFNYRSELYPPLATIRALKSLYFTHQPEHMSNSSWLEHFKSLVKAADSCGVPIMLPGVLTHVKARRFPNTGYSQLDRDERKEVDSEIRKLTLATLYLENSDKGRYGQLKMKLENNYLMGQKDAYPKSLTEAQTLLNSFKPEVSKQQSPPPKRESPVSGIAFAQNGDGKSVDRSRITCWRCGKKGHYSYEDKCKPADVAAYEALKAKQDNAAADEEREPEQTHVTEGETESSDTITEDTTSTGVCGLHHGYEEPMGADLAMADSFEQQAYAMMFCTVGSPVEPAVNYDTVFNQAGGQIDPDWVLLDNQSTVNVFCNPKMLMNIRPVQQRMYIHCNAGVAWTNLVGDLPGIGRVWYHKNGIANILSLSKVKRTNRVTFDSHGGNVFRLYNKDQSAFREFTESERGLYFSHMKNKATVLNMVSTVKANKEKFSALDRHRAERARKLQDVLNISTKELIRLVDNGTIPNCPVTRADISAAEDIYGRSVIGLKGKTVRRPEEHVRVEIAQLPPTILDRYMGVVLGADIMYVNSLRFFVTISRHIQFGTAELIADATTNTLLQCVKHVKQTYTKRGFQINTMNMDNQFEPLRSDLDEMGINPNLVARDEHVPEVERFIRTIKDRVRGIQTTVPFKKFPPLLTKGIVEGQLFWWNAVPKQSGVSPVLSPRTIVTGLRIDYNKHCRLQFGQYVQTHEETDNDTGHERTVSAIAIRPTGNQQGGYYFYSLRSGRIINRFRWTRLPMPNDAIDRIHTLARRQRAGIIFRDRNHDEFLALDDDSSDADSTYIPDEDDDPPDIPGVGPADNAGVPDNIDVDGHTIDATGVNNEDPLQHENENDANNEAREDDIYNTLAPRRNLRPRTERNYDHLKTVGYINNISGISRQTVHEQQFAIDTIDKYNKAGNPHAESMSETVMTQYNMNKGLKIFGEKGKAAVKKELQQFHDRHVVKPVQPSDMTREQRARSLAYLMFLKEKRCGTIKGRGCADGRKQRDWMTKEDTTSPTVSTAALILSCLIDAREHREVATADIPGAFLQTPDKSGSTHLRLEGTMVDLLLEIDRQKYEPYVQYGPKGRKFMYAECLKAIYGTLNAALLFWLKLSGDLREWGFAHNPYDWCVMNKLINGKQCTILWHVDDLKISHVDGGVVTTILEQINKEYGKEAAITVTRGKVHEYLGITIDYSVKGQVSFTMIDYIEAMLDELPEGLHKGEAATPAADHLFKIDEANKSTKLNEGDKELFHRTTAKLLFLSKRARPDVQLPVAFLCTRVRDPDTDDWKKLDRVLRYLRGTIGIPLILSADGKGSMRWFVDAAFAVHNDMKSHTGMMMTMGRGAVMSNSQKQKLVTRSSTEAELVGVDDEMSQILWCRYFLTAQGVGVTDNILYQDNQAAMKLESNGKRSSGKRTRHINIRYFFVTDRIAAGDISVAYCPTLDMIGDYFTKPLQGSHFKRLRNTIMGIEDDDIPRYNAEARVALARRRQRRQSQDDLTKPTSG